MSVARPVLVVVVSSSFLALNGCSAGPSVPEASMGPEPYRIAVAPVQLASLVRTDQPDALRFTKAEGFDQYLVDALREMNVASEVTLVPARAASTEKDGDLSFAVEGKYDLLLRPKLVQAEFGYDGLSESAFLSGALWLVTWFGGFFVRDCDYRSDLEIECETWNPCEGRLLQSTRARSEELASLSFWERNTFLSLGTLESLIVPPFWTHDRDDIASESLTERGTLEVASDVKRKLRDLPRTTNDSTSFPEIEILTPENGSVAGDSTDLSFRIVSARLGVSRVSIYVNDVLERDLRIDEGLPPFPEQQRPGGSRECPVDVKDLPLTNAGSNMVRIHVTLESDRGQSSRTLVLYGSAGAHDGLAKR